MPQAGTQGRYIELRSERVQPVRRVGVIRGRDPAFSGTPALLKLHALDVLADEDARHVGGLVPAGLFHVIGDVRAIDDEILESDILDGAAVIIADDLRDLGVRAGVRDIAKGDILDAATGRGIVLAIEEDAEIEDLALPDVLDADIVEEDIADEIAVPRIESETALVIELRLRLIENVQVAEGEILDGLGLLGIAMRADEDGMGDIGPEGGVPHGDVFCAAAIAATRGVDSDAVIRVAIEDAIDRHA